MGLLDAGRNVGRRHGFHFCSALECASAGALQAIMSANTREMGQGIPFAMEPVVYDFAANEQVTQAMLLEGDAALMLEAH
jgi:hypothetical protein